MRETNHNSERRRERDQGGERRERDVPVFGSEVRMKLIGRGKVVPVLGPGQVIRDLLCDTQSRLVSPTPRHIPHHVPTATQHQHWDVKALEKGDTLAVGLDGEVEDTEAIAGQRVSAALQHDCLGVVRAQDLAHHGLEHLLVAAVVDTVIQWHVHRVVHPGSLADICHVAGLRKEAPVVFVERHAHNAVCVYESFLHPVPVVYVDVLRVM